MRVGIGIGATFVTTKAAGGAPINTIAPSVTTTGKIGSGVTGSAGTWTGATSYTYQHQVYDDLNATWIDMTGETGLNVTSISSDNLSTARLAVTATGPGGSTTAYSDTYTITYVAPVITNVGSISGTYTVGQTLVHTGRRAKGASRPAASLDRTPLGPLPHLGATLAPPGCWRSWLSPDHAGDLSHRHPGSYHTTRRPRSRARIARAARPKRPQPYQQGCRSHRWHRPSDKSMSTISGRGCAGVDRSRPRRA